MIQTIGVDFGSQKTVVVADDGEIVRTDTGSISVPTMVSFVQQSRYVGDEAASFPVGGGRVSLLNLACGDDPARLLSPALPHEAFLAHCPAVFEVDQTSGAAVYNNIPYCDSTLSASAPALLAVLIGEQARRVQEVYGPDRRLAFVLPHGAGETTAKNVLTACAIAGIPRERVAVVGAVEALAASYCRKISALRPADKAVLQGKSIVFAEMGHTHSTISVVRVVPAEAGQAAETVRPLAVQASDTLGAMSFDICLFHHFCTVVEKKYGEEIVPGTKRGHRLMSGCERIRKLLSQLTEAQITVENLTDGGDISFSLKRDELTSICAEPLRALEGLVRAAVAEAGLDDPNAGGVFVEILGGGMRMQVAQNVLLGVFGEDTPLGAKFDDGSAALGAAIVANQRARPEEKANSETEGEATGEAETPAEQTQAADIYARFDDVDISTRADDIKAAREREEQMRVKDLEVRLLLAERNAMEAFMYEMKSATGRKHGELIDSAVLNKKMEEYENWLWDNPPESTPLEGLQAQFTLIRSDMADLMAAFNQAVAAEKEEFEKQLEQESQKAAAERELEGEDEDHDNRKLKKADRMRMVVKNKEEGNELFKGKNYRPAAARYHKSLTHASKFFDLSPDDEVEVKQVKLSLYLNLAQCYIKLENWDSTLRNCDEALTIDSNNPKALFRRSVVWEAKKEYEKALDDLRRAGEINPQDAMIVKAVDRVTKLIAKEKAKEKKMWGKAFGGAKDSKADSQI